MSRKCMPMLWGLLLLSTVSWAKTDQINNQVIHSDYKITLSDNKSAIFVAGKFRPGISQDVTSLYNANKDTVKSLMYSSTGGKLHESVTLYELARDNNLDTYAINYCFSACTTAFVGGQNRISLVQTKFGFHQFGIKNSDNIEAVKLVVNDAQQRNTSLFEQQGIESDFLNRIYSVEHSQMWNPSIIDLLKGKVVHKFFIDTSFITEFDITNKLLYPERRVQQEI